MKPRVLRRTHPIAFALITMTMLVATASTGAADTAHQRQAVTAWAKHQAHPVTADPAAALDDLGPLRRSISDASVVGLGESGHGAAEETTLKHRTLRMLIEQLGFRSVAWEDDWTTGIEIDDYIHGGPQHLDQLVATMSPQYQTREVADVLAWLRDFNAGRPDPVSFVGVEYYFTRSLAYDTVQTYVASTAPERLEELRDDLDPLRPTSDDPFQHIAAYQAVEDKQPYLDHAHAAYELIARLPHDDGDRPYELALHAARQIVSFYEHYAMPDSDALVYREARAADSLRWWQNLTGDRVAYWAASPHTANAPHLHIVQPGAADMRFASTGSYLRRWYGEGYRSIGFTLDHGTVALEPGQTAELARPSPEWFEAPLGDVDHAAFTLDLRGRAPEPVKRWLTEPLTTRGLPQGGAGGYIDGGSLGEWFDVLVHTQDVHPASMG